MKKLSALFLTICFILLTPLHITHAENESVSKEFKSKLEEKLQNEVNYYNKGSVQFEKALTMDGKIFKLISADDPETEENEEKTEEYNSNFTMAFVKYEQKRDSLFYFDKYDLYYYDNSKNEFLILSNIVQNEAAEKFFTEQSEGLHKEIQVPSLILSLVMLSMLFIFPLLIMIFHNKAKAKSHIYATNNHSISG
ncbi:hypothetical protein [Metabacillus litoralis]|uniref:hypothetical protein n=1 Tax=Metabacillus litoralis TaxID=152268 RepID=UPI001CFE4CC7|nr:hypothetical protein [Metabacillus litoralis]